jgi:translocation and assembly module TamA
VSLACADFTRLARLGLLVQGLIVACLALAQEPVYRLSVEAPTRELREMLARGLQLARWEADAQMTPELLGRLAEEAVLEAKKALSALGYYSAAVSTSIDRSSKPWAVVLRVEPGARTTVRSVEIRFTGPGADDPEAARALREVRRDWRLQPGAVFTQEAWIDAKREAVRGLSAWPTAGRAWSAQPQPRRSK